MGYKKQTFEDQKTILTAEMLDNIEYGILENEKNINLLSGNGGEVSISGDDFVDGWYWYGAVGETISSLSSSSKMAGYKDPIVVNAGQEVYIKIYIDATYGYLLTDDSNLIITTGALSGDKITIPNGVTKLYVNTLKTEKSNSIVTVESAAAQLQRNVSKLMATDAKKFQFDPLFDLTKVPQYEIPEKSTILGCNLETIYAQYNELVSNYPSYVTKIDCDQEVQAALNIEKPSELEDLPIYMYKFSPIRARNSSGNDVCQRKKVFITSMHPQERLGIWVMAKTLTMICEEWKNSYDVELLRSLIDIYVIPIAWPWNFNNNSRKNYNGINPNRSFPTKGWYETGQNTDNWTGTEAGSEYETKVVMYYFNQIKPDVSIDVHTSGHDNNGCMGIILCPGNDLNFITLCGVITRTTSNAAIKENPTFALNDPDAGGLYGVYPEAAPPPGEFYQWANEQGYGVSLLTEESPYCNWQDGVFLGADGSFVEEYTSGIFRQ